MALSFGIYSWNSEWLDVVVRDLAPHSSNVDVDRLRAAPPVDSAIGARWNAAYDTPVSMAFGDLVASLGAQRATVGVIVPFAFLLPDDSTVFERDGTAFVCAASVLDYWEPFGDDRLYAQRTASYERITTPMILRLLNPGEFTDEDCEVAAEWVDYRFHRGVQEAFTAGLPYAWYW